MAGNYDIKSGRIDSKEIADNFCDMHPPLSLDQAKIEASRCYFCHDAPCIEACPTDINIPSFIKKISTENLKGSAVDILNENIFGGMCARVCPVESLCQGSCVRNTAEDKPVEIGQLQKYATDWLFEKGIQPYKRSSSNGKKVAVVGAGPAGLSCAHRLSRYGYDVTVYEAKDKAGGLNEYGIAAYKVVDDFAQKEIKFITDLGGIEIKLTQRLGRDIQLSQLRKEYDSVFLAVGLSGVNALRMENEELPGVIDAVDYIAKLRQSEDLASLPVGRRIVVIGGGSTAIDIAVQTKRLGAEFVTLVYRRGENDMKATWVERQWAQKSGVLIKTWSSPSKIIGDENGVTSIEFERTKMDEKGKRVGTGHKFEIEVDQVFKAIGQVLLPCDVGDGLEMLDISNGMIQVNENKQTTLPDVYAGGDCVNKGELTVVSVQDGKIAAEAIHKKLSGEKKKAASRFVEVAGPTRALEAGGVA